MDLASFIVGMVVAWIIALLIYWFGVQRDATERIANTVPLNEHLTQVQDAEDRIAQLQSELQESQKALEEAQAERERLRAENEQLHAEVESLTPKEVSAAAEESAAVEPSDLKRIEGIGPKIEEILNNAGIHTFQQMAEASVERLQAALEEAGERYRLADPGSWPQQARLAAEEKWDELAALQDELKGGR